MEKTVLVRFAANQVLFAQGDTSREMYIVRAGRVRVQITKNGTVVPVVELGPGAFVGEMSFISGIPRTATVIAMEPVIASVIGVDMLANNALGITDWAFNLAKVLVQRLRKTTMLLGNYRSWGGAHPGGESVGIELTDQEDRFSVAVDEGRDPDRLYLKGRFLAADVDEIKTRLREHKLKARGPITMDFSDVIDIDNEALDYMHGLMAGPDARDGRLRIQNVQLIRNKILAIRGMQEAVSGHDTPVKRLEQGEVLITQGDVGGSMYVVKSGTLNVYREVDGKSVLLSQAQAGDVIGEMSLIKEGLRSATVKAAKPCVVYEIATRDFHRNIYNVPAWFMAIIQGLVDRLRQTNSMIDIIVKNREPDNVTANWRCPLGIFVDAHKTGGIVLQGHLVAGNLAYLDEVIKLKRKLGVAAISIDLSRLKRLDKECIVFLLNLFMELKAEGGELDLVGPQKEILNLFKQYEIDI